MIREVRSHPIDYLLLLLGLLILSTLYIFFIEIQITSILLSLSIGLFYFAWGVWHHERVNMIKKVIVKEYFFAACFAATILILLSMS